MMLAQLVAERPATVRPLCRCCGRRVHRPRGLCIRYIAKKARHRLAKKLVAFAP